MTINYQEIANYYESEFERLTLAMDAPNAKIDYYRIDPAVRVCMSDLQVKFPEFNHLPDRVEFQPYWDKAKRRLKRKGLWRMPELPL